MYNFFFTSLGKAYIAHLNKNGESSHIDILCVNSTSRSILMEWDTAVYMSTIDSVSKDVKSAALKEVLTSDNKVILTFSDSKNAGGAQLNKEKRGPY